MNEGWICPRCGRVNAPFTTQCNCKPSYKSNLDNDATSSQSVDISECLKGNHLWEQDNVLRTDGTHYRCKRCGATKVEIIKNDYSVTLSC